MSEKNHNFIPTFLKGIGMGAANVIPGVSGGTIALITGIYEKLINSLKSFDLKAFKLLMKGDFKAFGTYINFNFLVAVFLGVGFSIVSLAKLLEYFFENYPIYLWAFFFGLIMASVYYVGKTIEKWNLNTIVSMILGTAIAIMISLLNPTTENNDLFYLFLCGIVAISSMILPGLSGSFVLILMGNYMLILTSISKLDLAILAPFGLGCLFGLLAFSHLLAWVFKKFKDATISLLTGFILGSLLILWPWKNTLYLKDEVGVFILKDNEKVVQGYQWFFPEIAMETLLAVALIISGIASIWVIEFMGNKVKS